MRIITPRKAAVITICCVPIILVYIALLHQDDPDDVKAKYVPRWKHQSKKRNILNIIRFFNSLAVNIIEKPADCQMNDTSG